jgi:hypothetical protein
LLLLAPLTHADGALVLRAGSVSVDAQAFSRRMALLSPTQLAALGARWAEQRRRFLDEVLIPEALLEGQARQSPALSTAADAALAQALLTDLLARARDQVTEAELASYYEQHRDQFETPSSILIWRIRVPSEPRARELIAQLRTPNSADFRRLAREHSSDSATAMRGGSLGYVASDGQSHLPEVRVSPALFAAASRVKDGELVGEPVVEGAELAVVWRRATRPAQAQSLADAAEEVAALLAEEKLGVETRALLERLRAAEVTAHQPGLLEGFEPRELPAPRRAPGPRAPAALRPVRLEPQMTDRGLR